MIDFRYHLVSIVAVLLALAIGIVLGSGFLGGPLLSQLERQLNALDDRNRDLIREGVERDRLLEGYVGFAEAVQAELIRGTLIGRRVVVVTVEGTDGTTVDRLRDSIELAGGTVASTLRILASFALEDEQQRASLGAVAGAGRSGPEEMRRDVADLLATRVAAASSLASERPRVGPTADERLERMVDELAAAGFLDVERLEEGVTAPGGAAVLVVGGGPVAPPFDPEPMLETLGLRLAEEGTVVVAASPAADTWGITQSICDDPAAAEEISTVDHADTVYGQTSVVLSLAALPAEEPGHYGLESCATGVIPEPASAG